MHAKKMHKWGFKNFVRTGFSGIIYDFFLHAGSKSAGWGNCGAEDGDLRLVDEVPRNEKFRLFFDN